MDLSQVERKAARRAEEARMAIRRCVRVEGSRVWVQDSGFTVQGSDNNPRGAQKYSEGIRLR